MYRIGDNPVPPTWPTVAATTIGDQITLVQTGLEMCQVAQLFQRPGALECLEQARTAGAGYQYPDAQNRPPSEFYGPRDDATAPLVADLWTGGIDPQQGVRKIRIIERTVECGTLIPVRSIARNAPMPSRNSHLALSALGKDRPGIIDHLTRAILDADCNILDTRMAVLSGDFAILMSIEAPWDKLARLESQIPELQRELGLTIIVDRTEPDPRKVDLLPYGVDVVALDQPGIVHNLAAFFSQRSINIEDMTTSSYAAAHTGTPMFAVRMTVGIPATMHITSLREEFMDFCDQLNLDAVLEPVKG